MLDYRSTVAAAGFVGALLVGCTDPDELSDLRGNGPPNITAVTVMSDLETAVDPSGPFGRIVETATYCRPNDDKRPGIVGLPDIRAIQVCPDAVEMLADEPGKAEGAPPVWFVRIVFDRLLDASIEDLVAQPNGITIGTIKSTQPVSLTCDGAAVPYDGYYVPNGNRTSWPLGPALFIQPDDPTSVRTGASCAVSIRDNVHSKSRQSVPNDQRNYAFKLAPMALRFSNPAVEDASDGSFQLDPSTPVSFFWTAAIAGDPMGTGKDEILVSKLDRSQVKLSFGPNLNVSPNNLNGDADPTVCNGGGTLVDPQMIRALVRGDVAAAKAAGNDDEADAIPSTTALILDIDVMGVASPLSTRWAPKTTYSITFTPDAKVKPAQGGPDGTFPSDLKLCFHTSA